MKVLVAILIIVAGVVWYLKRQQATPEKAKAKLENANATPRLTVQPPVKIERFDVAEDFSVTAHLAQGPLPGFSDAEQLSLKDLAGKICSVIGKRVNVTFKRGDKTLLIKP